MNKTRAFTTSALVALGLASTLALTGCGSNADTVSANISKEAEQFKVGRRIVVTNSITDKPIYSIEGRCSFEVGSRRLDVICRDRMSGPENRQFTKATFGLGDNTTWASVQLAPITVSEYRTKIILRPETIVPDFDLVSGDEATKGTGATQPEGGDEAPQTTTPQTTTP